MSTDTDNKNEATTIENFNVSDDESFGNKVDKEKVKEAGKSAEKSDSGEFSREYLQKLREENKKHRLKAKELEDKLAELKNSELQASELSKESLEKVNKLHGAFEKRLINAELQQIALKEGLIDIDAFKMVDLSSVKISEEGEVIGLNSIIDELKTKKPYLFKLSSNSNQDAKLPSPAELKNKRPVYENSADFEKAKRALLASLV